MIETTSTVKNITGMYVGIECTLHI